MSRATRQQRQAVEANGNVVVVAGAGTGKTRTLVDRCLDRLLQEPDPIGLDRILVVTFTEAAAAEMRQRIRARLEEEARLHPDHAFLGEQVALAETARISTLHSFCYQLVRVHFHELRLDPEVMVMEEGQARLVSEEVLDRLLDRVYADEGESAAAIRQFIAQQGGGGDRVLRDLVIRLHRYAQSLADPGVWWEREHDRWNQESPACWRAWLLDTFPEWRARWLAILTERASEQANFAACRSCLDRDLDLDGEDGWEQMGDVLAALSAIDEPENWPRGTKKYRQSLKTFFSQVGFLSALMETSGERAALNEDWDWVRGQMLALVALVTQFGEAFWHAKREQGLVDFQDLEQLSLTLLRDRVTGQPTPIAEEWQRQFDLVFVDEYQDINGAQDAILRLVSRSGDSANRFLVGDVKQSIYRFRLADPRIFQAYLARWEAGEGAVLRLTENFRSHEGILSFANALFGNLMRGEVGGVTYDATQSLEFGAPEARPALRLDSTVPPRVALHLFLPPTEESEEAETLEPAADGESRTEQEARWIGGKLAELHRTAAEVWDDHAKAMRPVAWGDMAILMRSPSGRAEVFARVFSELGIPLDVERSGFYEAQEVRDLLCLLQLLDNPLQDLPLLAFLRSPLVGMTVEELALVRLADRRATFWNALQAFLHGAPAQVPAEPGSKDAQPSLRSMATEKVARALADLERWRRWSRREALSGCLERILDETEYEAWWETQDLGIERRWRVQRFLQLTRQFDHHQRQGLYRFLRYVESQQRAGTEPSAPGSDTGTRVRLLSIHRAKGLEFPVVVAADLGRTFNFSDTRGRLILDEEYGLCPSIHPPGTSRSYPSLPHWLAQQRQQRALLGEEIRLLYVAVTRARDFLFLTGGMGSETARKKWGAQAEKLNSLDWILGAQRYLDWLVPWCAKLDPSFESETKGSSSCLSWSVHEWSASPAQPNFVGRERTGVDEVGSEQKVASDGAERGAFLKDVAGRLAWVYPDLAATRQLAKGSVSSLRRQLVDVAEDPVAILIDETMRLQMEDIPSKLARGHRPDNAAEIGTLHHLLLEHLDLTQMETPHSVRAEMDRLIAVGVLNAEEATWVDQEAVFAFWESSVGQQIRGESDSVHREIPFTARFSAGDLRQVRLPCAKDLAEDEFVVLQGIIDLAVILPNEIWVLDYKTDRLRAEEIPSRLSHYAPQLKTYALALERIYHRPVSRLWLHFLNLRQTVDLRVL